MSRLEMNSGFEAEDLTDELSDEALDREHGGTKLSCAPAWCSISGKCAPNR